MVNTDGVGDITRMFSFISDSKGLYNLFNWILFYFNETGNRNYNDGNLYCILAHG